MKEERKATGKIGTKKKGGCEPSASIVLVIYPIEECLRSLDGIFYLSVLFWTV